MEALMEALAKILEAQRHLTQAAVELVAGEYSYRVSTELSAAEEYIDHARKLLREDTST